MSFFANTPIGSIEIVTQNGRVVEFVMPGWQGSYRREEDDISLKRQQDIIDSVMDYFSGGSKKEVEIAWKNMIKVCGIDLKDVAGNGTFTYRVYDTLLKDVPSGTTISYQELAALAGNEKAARAVGTAMRKNPLPLLIPCHRVVRASGELGGYMGMDETGLKVKRWLLDNESAR
ncbi:MAG: methylated-DNA--[protein]-cysteine S-methyltransferase [Acidimicrobiia bacterium]